AMEKQPAEKSAIAIEQANRFTEPAFRSLDSRRAARAECGHYRSNGSSSGRDEHLLTNLQQTALGQYAERHPVELPAVGQSAHMETAVGSQEPDRLVLYQRLSNCCRFQLYGPQPFAIAPECHDPPRAIHHETALGARGEIARERRVERP